VTETRATVADILRGLDASALLPAPHHTPRQTPDEARARQANLARAAPELGRVALLQLYEGMLRVEAFERTLEASYFAGHVAGGVHLYLGEEAVAVGVCSALRPTDMVTSTHRGHGHAVAKSYFSLLAGDSITRTAHNEALIVRGAGYDELRGRRLADPAALERSSEGLFAELFGRAAGVSVGSHPIVTLEKQVLNMMENLV
jgi:TPP-dependent pyruvate/acetoin dehydrogenase alpha subunit